MSDMFEGVFTALVTPFHQGEVDWDSLGSFVEFQIRQGVHGLVPCGTTGESATLSAEEHDKVVRFVVDSVAGRVPVIAGTGSNSTREAVERTRSAQAAGADAALVITPYYNKPMPDGLCAHYREIAEVGLPVIVYNVPSRTAMTIGGPTYAELAKIPGIVATKEASGCFDLVDEILSQDFPVLSGEDALTFPLLCLGACGVISVTSNVAPRLVVDLFDLVQEGQLEAARDLHRRLLPLMNALFLETNPGPVKAALSRRGLVRDELRLPLQTVSDATREQVEQALEHSAALAT